jgi:hypothetical protein
LGLLSFLVGCGQNPLLSSVSADYAPIRLGSQWTYTDPAGSLSFSRQVSAAGVVQGRNAFTVVSQIGALPASTNYWSLQSGAWESYSAALGWTLLRRLPYVPGNKWLVPTGNPLITVLQSVEALESVDVPAGRFPGSYRLKTQTSTYDPLADVTATAESLLWAAPNVGDIRYATVAANGTVTVTLELSSYRIPR